MPRTFSDDKNFYSVDMMFVYLKNHKHPITKINVSKYSDTLEYPGWGDPGRDINYSAMDVIKNPSKYQDDYKRILKADLSYPIIVSNNGYIIDGVHRLAKAFMHNVYEIKAYIFDEDLMEKFKIAEKTPNIWDKIQHLEAYELIDLYFQRFCK
jgi:hypothetical protein